MAGVVAVVLVAVVAVAAGNAVSKKARSALGYVHSQCLLSLANPNTRTGKRKLYIIRYTIKFLNSDLKLLCEHN